MPRVQPQVDWQKERPEHLVLARVVALVHQQAGRDGRRGDDHPSEGDRAETSPSKKERRQAAGRFSNQECVPLPRNRQREQREADADERIRQAPQQSQHGQVPRATAHR